MLEIESPMLIRGPGRDIIILTWGLGLHKILSEYFWRIICYHICIMDIYVKIAFGFSLLVIWPFSHKSKFVETDFFPVFSDRKKPDITSTYRFKSQSI